MIGSFNIGDFDLKFSITEIKLCQIKALYNVICSSVVLVRLIIIFSFSCSFSIFIQNFVVLFIMLARFKIVVSFNNGYGVSFSFSLGSLHMQN